MIFYFSGTGNSKWVAEQVTKQTDDRAYDICDTQMSNIENEAFIGLVFPIYAWGTAEPYARTKCYPSRVLADKIYRNRSNIAYCKERGIRLSGPALGRPPKDVQPDKKQNYIDECERVEVERRFSLAKRVCGLGLIPARLKETACHCIAMSIFVQLIGVAVFNEKIGVCSVDIIYK